MALREINRFADSIAALPEAISGERGGAAAPAAALDRAVASVLAPLAAATQVLADGRVGDHWIALDASTPAAAAALPDLLADLERRFAAAALDDTTRRLLAEILDFLKRGSAYDDLRHAAAAHAALMAEILDLTGAVAAAAWLSDEQRALIQERLRSALAEFRDRATRDEGTRRLDQLAMARSVIEKVTALSRPGDDELDQVRAGFLAGFGAGAEEWTAAQRQRLLLLLDRLIAYRALSDGGVPADLRAIRKRLDASYRQAEKALLREAATLMSKPAALTDPAFSSLIASHAQYLADLERLGRAAEWSSRIALAAPAAASANSNQIRRWCQWLVESGRRPQAIVIMDRFQDQIDRFSPLPGEDAIRRGDTSAATGGLERELIATIDTARQAWGAAWGEGTGDGGAANRMALLERLTRAIGRTAAVTGSGDAPILDAWAPWELNQGTYERILADVPGRLKLATAAAVAGDDRELSLQLDRIEAEGPPAIMIAALAGRLAPRLALLPAGALGTLGQLVEPAPETWPLDRRRDLALFCRGALELEYARATGRGDLEATLRVFVNELAEQN